MRSKQRVQWCFFTLGAALAALIVVTPVARAGPIFGNNIICQSEAICNAVNDQLAGPALEADDALLVVGASNTPSIMAVVAGLPAAGGQAQVVARAYDSVPTMCERLNCIDEKPLAAIGGPVASFRRVEQSMLSNDEWSVAAKSGALDQVGGQQRSFRQSHSVGFSGSARAWQQAHAFT